MSNVLTRRFTRRELFMMMLLVLVVLVGLYFYMVHYPITQRHEQIETERDEIALSTQVAEIRAGQYRDMKSELDEIFAMPEDELTVMPEYDNIQTLMNYFNVIFAGTGQALNFDEVRFNGNIAVRTMRFSFTASSYRHAKRILGQLTDTGFRCQMESVSIVPAEADGEVESGVLKISGSITFYEFAA